MSTNTNTRPVLWTAVQVCGECGEGHFQTAKDYGYGPVCEVCEHVHAVDPRNLDADEAYGYDSHGHLTVTAYDTTEED